MGFLVQEGLLLYDSEGLKQILDKADNIFCHMFIFCLQFSKPRASECLHCVY